MGKRITTANYSKEFKEDVINYYKNNSNNYTQNEVAEKFGVNPGTLKYWIMTTKKHHNEAFVGSGNLRTEDAELKALNRKIKDLEEENAILKKAMAIFSRNQ